MSSIFPINSVTYNSVQSGNSTDTIANGYPSDPVTVWGISMQQSKVSSETIIYCGTVPIAKNYAQNYDQRLMRYKCENALTVVKTGNDESFLQMTYSTGSPIWASSTIQGLYTTGNGFTYGEIVISLLLFLLVLGMIFGGVWNRLLGVKIKVNPFNTFLGNNSREGKKIYND